MAPALHQRTNMIIKVNPPIIDSTIEIHGYSLKRKKEFHVTVLNWDIERQLKDAGILEQVMTTVNIFMDMNTTTVEYTGNKRLLHKNYPQYDSYEVSLIREVKADWLQELILKINRVYSLDIPIPYPHVTLYTLNGRGIAVDKKTVNDHTILSLR